MANKMNVLHIEVASLAESAARAVTAMQTGKAQGRYLSFETPERLLSTLSGHRLAVLHALLGGEPIGVRELARRLGRDVRGVHNDTQRLVATGVIEKLADGKLRCAYAEIVCEFSLRQAA